VPPKNKLRAIRLDTITSFPELKIAVDSPVGEYSCPDGRMAVDKFRDRPDLPHLIVKAVTGQRGMSRIGRDDIGFGTEVYMIGHPSGLPQKVAVNASVRSLEGAAYFYTSLDAFQGNSGSPVFDRNTGEVIGILV